MKCAKRAREISAGAARYTYDVRLPGMLYARVRRCPHAHARLTKFDSSSASKIPGVKAIIQTPLKEFRFAGSPVAAVAAITPEIAHDAIRALVVEYEVLPHVVLARDAIKPESPEVLPRDPRKPDERNLRLANKTGDVEKVEAALKSSDAIVEAEYSTSRVHHCCLETHGMVVDYSGGDSATIYATTQGTFTIPDDAANELGLPQSGVTGTVPHMGGGFGSQFGLGIKGMLACRRSKETKTALK